MQKQQGFVLLSVLIITTIITILAFSQISENRLQERIAGNQQKEINARLASEQGIIKAYEYIKEQNALSVPNATIESNLKANSFVPVGANYSLPAQYINLNGSTFTLVSMGSYQGATAYLKTEIEAIEITGKSLFTDAVAGCDGVYVGQGGGTVDSYNSSLGPYDPNAHNDKGNVSTINSGADIELSGSGSIYGNLTSNGSISTGTSSGSSISGAATAANNIQFKGITSTSNIHAGGNLDFKGLIATGQEITVGGDLYGDNGKDISSSVIYGGENHSNLKTAIHSDQILPPEIDFGECDPLDIVTEMTAMKGQVPSGSTNSYSATMIGSNLQFNGAEVSSDGTPIAGVAPVTLDVFGEPTEVYIFDEFTPIGQDITITGDITLLITGDILTKNSNFVFADDTSSLTILTDGSVNLDSLTDLFADETVNSEGEAPLTIYSSYESSNDSDMAVTVGSNADMYARIYAPNGNLDLGGGGDIMGAVRGKEVNVSAGTGIHYDEMLSDMIDIPDEEPTAASFTSVHYFYP
ncbi:hypothetical protein [Psychromonas sp. MME2]|uniref:DUF7305 domain-containing protein n=1 Tax=unclassified Psychromonas TaxID=2614957 RepID=UPI00339CCBB3